MSKKLNLSKNTKMIIALVLVAIISIGFSFAASKPEMYKPVYEVLDEKRVDALALSAGALGLSTGLSAVFGDKIDPITDLLSEVTSYITIVNCVLFLEKLLLTSAGFISFAILIPISCLLGIVYMFIKKETLKAISIKLVAFALVLFLVVPSGVFFSKLIENTNIYDVTETQIDNTDESNEDIGFWENFKNLTNDVKETATEKANEFIDAVSIMLITTCAIPLGTLALMLWIVKMLFGINVKMPNPPKIKIPTKQKEISEKTDIPQISNQ